ncbi:alpha-glucosidase [Palleronia aestuarii]|uniref:Alpha-glucosidase n=1 Tax=Palleronia aestuarii TaxID=568105 RepID=A0A2W7PZP5_9RHOB|nr:alpha-amylase family glycosyl hydrolase [Palleronia aestuarii]PZX15009.1 alpha-glucosidase [Palleronia aestuarii]
MSKTGDWRKAPVIYEIYVRSFADSTGSGIGDLRGVTERLEHVAALGVDAIWLCPFFVSPLDDGGYDIVNHREVAERHGTIEDFDALVARAHELGLKVLIDQVFNHTSCDHPKFEAAIAGDEDEAACYLWRDPKPDGTAPNNWISQFGQPAWTWNHRRRQYYLHQFLPCQPSLNLRNPRVREMHCETINFWLDRGVDGFRLDAVTSYLYDESLADNPPARPVVQDQVSGPNYNPYTYQDHVYDMLPGDGAAFAETVRSWVGGDVFLLGESTSGNQSIKLAMDFSEPGRLDFCYTHDAIHGAQGPQLMADVLRDLDGRWRLPWWFSCHDQPRHNSKLGDGTPESARFFALLLAPLPGPVLIYQGEELGLSQPKLSYEENTDPFDRLYWPDPPGREGPRVPIPWTEDGPARGDDVPARGVAGGGPRAQRRAELVSRAAQQAG